MSPVRAAVPGARTDEYLATMTALWGNRRSDYSGRYTSFRGATLGVTPMTPGGPPLWVGGNSEAALRRALRFGQAWHGTGVSPQDLPTIRQQIDTIADGVDRDPTTLRLTTTAFVLPPGYRPHARLSMHHLGGAHATADSIIGELLELKRHGITACNLWIPVPPDHVPRAIDWLADNVLGAPELTT
ncbi:MAG: LLM class flavin-dependent oxidoreductase [Mycobacteriaceae bacterium]|nr:LLM class flavin-dependent oxidoreductase [Mycobacteriaceae bacterium]